MYHFHRDVLIKPHLFYRGASETWGVMKGLMKRLATVLVGLALLAAPASALAQNSSECQAYNPQLCATSEKGTSTSSAGTLPFTGLDVALLAVGGGGLLATGLVVRRLSRRLD